MVKGQRVAKSRITQIGAKGILAEFSLDFVGIAFGGSLNILETCNLIGQSIHSALGQNREILAIRRIDQIDRFIGKLRTDIDISVKVACVVFDEFRFENTGLTIGRSSDFGEVCTDVKVGAIGLAVRIEEVQMVPRSVRPAVRGTSTLALLNSSQRFTRITTVIIHRQFPNVHNARSRQVGAAQIHSKHAIHENPHIIVAGKFKDFLI